MITVAFRPLTLWQYGIYFQEYTADLFLYWLIQWGKNGTLQLRTYQFPQAVTFAGYTGGREDY